MREMAEADRISHGGDFFPLHFYSLALSKDVLHIVVLYKKKGHMKHIFYCLVLSI
jgi:hypothetical protein